MIGRRLVSGLMTLMAVHFAALGAQPLCAGDNHGAAAAGTTAMTDMAHDGPMDRGPTDPCTPTTPGSPPGHSPQSCLAMTGCVSAGLGSLRMPAVVAPPMAHQAVDPEPPNLRSVISTPETPPPIA